MIFTPWAISLTLCSVTIMFLLLRVVIPAVVILYKGERCDSEFHLIMEKQEMLGSAVLWLAWAYLMCSPFLLAGAAFDLGKQIPGVMCALGTFNANVYGYPFLILRLSGIFFVLTWIVLYAMDQQTATTPFRKARRLLMIFLFPWLILDTILQTLFFYYLDPTVITSCCAVVFDPTGTLSDSPVGILTKYPSLVLFFIISGLYLLSGLLALNFDFQKCRLSYGLLSPFFFSFGIAAIISCISPYIYALPHHHCPFCILTGKEGWIGIPLMISLYVGGISGWHAGVWETASRFVTFPGRFNPGKNLFFKVSVAANSIFIAGCIVIAGIYEIFGEFI